MKSVIANSQLHLKLEREGWKTVYIKGNVATLVRDVIPWGLPIH